MEEKRLSHLDEEGKAHMVDVTKKDVTYRRAVARGSIRVSKTVYDAIVSGNVPKGDVFATARIAGIMAAKKTHELIPLCHPLMLTGINVDFILPKRAQQQVVSKALEVICQTIEDVSTSGKEVKEKQSEVYEIECECTVTLSGKTGVEMEALTGVSVALLTVYDMCNALDKTMEIGQIRLMEKEGGKSGHFLRDDSDGTSHLL